MTLTPLRAVTALLWSYARSGAVLCGQCSSTAPPPESSLQMPEIQSKHPKLFGELGVLQDVFKINLKEDAVPMCLCVPRRVPIGLREAKKMCELERMEKLGVIEKVEHQTS